MQPTTAWRRLGCCRQSRCLWSLLQLLHHGLVGLCFSLADLTVAIRIEALLKRLHFLTHRAELSDLARELLVDLLIGVDARLAADASAPPWPGLASPGVMVQSSQAGATLCGP